MLFKKYERKSQKLAPLPVFLRRLAKNLLFAFAVMFISLCIGILGYHYLARMSWIDSLLNSAMILSGMGPVGTIETAAGKWFASLYALFSGVVFITNIGIILAPVIHRLIHRLHLEEKG